MKTLVEQELVVVNNKIAELESALMKTREQLINLERDLFVHKGAAAAYERVLKLSETPAVEVE